MQRISVSKIRAAMSCPLQYALTYGRGFFDLGTENVETEYGFYGAVLRNAFSGFFEKNFRSDDSFANWGYYQTNIRMRQLHNSRKELVFADADNLQKYMSRIKPVLKRFYRENMDEDRGLIEVNKSISARVDSGMHDVMLTGVVDLVKRGGETIARHYKTGSRKLDEFNVEKNPQLGIYSLVFESMEKKRPVMELYVPGYGDVETYREQKQFTDEEHRIVKDIIMDGLGRIFEISSKLVNRQRIEPSYGGQCRFCVHTYSGACDKYTDEGWIDNFSGNAMKISPLAREEKPRAKKAKIDKNQYEMKFYDAPEDIHPIENTEAHDIPNEAKASDCSQPAEPPKAVHGKAIRFDGRGEIFFDDYNESEREFVRNMVYNEKRLRSVAAMKHTMFRL